MLVDSYGLLSLVAAARLGGGGRVGPPRYGRHLRSSGRVRAVRPGTTIMIAALLFLILGAAVIQFVIIGK